MKILVTGGLGFIGSAVCRKLVKDGHKVITIDKGTYASNIKSVNEIKDHPNFTVRHMDLANDYCFFGRLNEISPDGIIHLAAETHVDNSITNPDIFIRSNILGTHNLLEWTRKNLLTKFHYVSTDEVFGTLDHDHLFFSETSKINPRNPYAATKASAEHLVRAYTNTYRINSVITNCCNNYGPWQNKEKLIPKTIINAIKGEKIPVYGSGNGIRDWLYVEDHVDAILKVFFDSESDIGDTYCIGAQQPATALDIVLKVCNLLDKKIPKEESYKNLISFVDDRPGADLAYALNTNKINTELDWWPTETLDSGLEKTIIWYIENYGN